MSCAIVVFAAIGVGTIACAVMAVLLMAWALWTEHQEAKRRDRELIALLIGASRVSPRLILTETKGRG